MNSFAAALAGFTIIPSYSNLAYAGQNLKLSKVCARLRKGKYARLLKVQPQVKFSRKIGLYSLKVNDFGDTISKVDSFNRQFTSAEDQTAKYLECGLAI